MHQRLGTIESISLAFQSPTRAFAAALFVASLSVLSVVRAAEPADDGAAAFLELESVLDGRCQILSEGGKLRVIKNTHASRTVRYRLIRMFAGNHPQGRSIGSAPPGAEPVKLGCTRVDGRTQDWIVERARFE